MQRISQKLEARTLKQNQNHLTFWIISKYISTKSSIFFSSQHTLIIGKKNPKSWRLNLRQHFLETKSKKKERKWLKKIIHTDEISTCLNIYLKFHLYIHRK